MNIKRIIISVYNKNKLDFFANFFYRNDVEIISTGGTAEFLEKKGIKVTKISDYTGFPEILEGRVKSVHPKLFGGVLSKSNIKSHDDDIDKFDIPKIDMVIVNLQPFEEISKKTSSENELIEYIDIGGVALLRAAAKNYKDVVPVVDPDDYETIIENIEDCGDVPLHTRRKLSLKAFYRTSKYDSNIHKVFSELFASEKFEHEFFEIVGSLRYGSNPLQDATLMKFAEKNSILDKLNNLTTHKAPTLRILKDLKLLFNIASKSNKDLLAFAKKGVLIYACYDPNDKDYSEFKNKIKSLKGGIVYSDNEEFLLSLKESKLDAIITSKKLDKTLFINYKFMVFEMEKFIINLKNEYVIDEDIIIKQEFIDLKIDLNNKEEVAFEIAKKHKSDTVVYVKGNKIYSGIQSALNRNVALITLEEVVKHFDDTIEKGLIILDSPINSEKIINIIINWKIEKVIIPSPLPKEDNYINTLKENNVQVVVTPRRFHKY